MWTEIGIYICLSKVISACFGYKYLNLSLITEVHVLSQLIKTLNILIGFELELANPYNEL